MVMTLLVAALLVLLAPGRRVVEHDDDFARLELPGPFLGASFRF